MQGIASSSFRFVIAATMVGILTSSAYAYLDPGTGSMILQVLLGGVAGLALAGKLYWQKLLSVLGIRRKSEDLHEARPDRS
jgi:hypothetical protein